MNARSEILYSTISILFSVSVLILSVSVGHTGRVFLSEPAAHSISSPEEAIEFWKSKGLKGRVIYHFETSLSHGELSTFASANNYLFTAVIENVARQVNYVVPDYLWKSISEGFSIERDTIIHDRPIKMFVAGTPVHIMKLSHVRNIREPVIITSDGCRWESFAINLLLKGSHLESDLTMRIDTHPSLPEDG